ncbi:hypothetical protein [Tenacibaculum geojense]|uniref:DUF3784 domain-containing protein n=1 Tax=Tenacibaculum geojense TaxID=915352 RepID=A0ABW3JMF7_9FLAO
MKNGIISIIVALVGIIFIIWINVKIATLFETEFMKTRNINELDLRMFKIETLDKIIGIGIGLTGILLGIKSLQKRNRIGIIGIILCVVLIILTFAPVWKYVLSDSAIDINFID